jgi:acetyltransferase-like isoleucine patch superfamily enzyme
MNNLLKSCSVHLVRHVRMWGHATVPWSCFIGENVEIERQTVVRPHARLEKNVCLHRKCLVGQYAVLSNVEVGEDSHVEYGVVITGYGTGRIVIGRESYIGIYNVLDWSDDLTIGNFVHIAGPSTGIWTHTSVRQALSGDPLSEKAKRETKPVRIEDYVYIGGNCTIYPGVTIGHHSIIAPNSAVTADVLPHTVVGGVPARVISERHSDSSI